MPRRNGSWNVYPSNPGEAECFPGLGRGRPRLGDFPRNRAGLDVDGAQEALARLVGIARRLPDAFLEHEDVVISVDGQPFSQALLKDRKPGDRVTFEVKHRGGVTGKGTLTFGTDPSRQAVLNESAGKPLTAEQKAFRMAWLGSQQR